MDMDRVMLWRAAVYVIMLGTVAGIVAVQAAVSWLLRLLV